MLPWIIIGFLSLPWLILSRAKLQKWQESILFIDTIAGILLGIYSTSLYPLLTTNSQMLVSWLAICTIIILIPIAWYMPFVGQKRAERIVIRHVQEKKLGSRAIVDESILQGWKWQISGKYWVGGSGYPAYSGAVVNAKCGNIEKTGGL